MQRQLLRWAVAPVALVALTACTVSSVHISDRVDRTVTPTAFSGAQLTNASAADDNVTLSANGGRMVYELNVGSTRGYQALYVALDEDGPNSSWDDEVELRVYASGGGLYASATTEDYFGRGSLGLQGMGTMSEGLDAQATTNLACPGSCVIIPSDTGTLYFEARNVGNTSRTIDVYAVLRDFEDQNEPNESSSGAPMLDSGGADGSLEVFGDEDVYRVGEDGDYTLNGNSASGIEYQAEVYDTSNLGGDPVDIVDDGETTHLFAGDFVLVKAINDRAAVAGKSRYFLDFQN